MTRRRFFAPPSAFSARQSSVTLSTDEARYLREILRLKQGDEVYVFNGEGKEFQCTIEESRRDSARLNVLQEVAAARPESPLDLTLGIALLKGEKFDLVVQKATELGVKRIVPLMTRLADVRLKEGADAEKRVMRWQRIAMEAAKQCGRAVVPEVFTPRSFDEVVAADVVPGAVRLMFTERDGESLAGANLPRTASAVEALVGSEGGWTEHELSAARAANWTLITLGGRTLRAETAGIAVVVLLQHLYGDLS